MAGHLGQPVLLEPSGHIAGALTNITCQAQLFSCFNFIFLLFRDGKANSSGEDSHGNDSYYTGRSQETQRTGLVRRAGGGAGRWSEEM